ncbi:flagellar hook-associated protein FlgK [Heliophilum fasciatum]|uniref:Flagellar hook-associated protein 1 n=1 Tax=Heliophilum fasciatum TaxID=35700 RepID=A0A4R2RLT0_9FIRM|nr:flagellar hook-associated protein FlgK [Heliophilum fasciatum]MCW2278821.1 flagellar hook-associated protein 1 FlgK [Heliophilum fasciatum]TCP64093.1 flagellar hook-associated protein 1 FlgK [Heliophilum fasciatum]
MVSTFFGLEIARRGVLTGKMGLDVTSHNVANANTEGYSRQTANISATPSVYVPGMKPASWPGQIGTGAEVAEIKRYRDDFLDRQYRNENARLGEWQSRADTTQRIQMLLNETGETGLSKVIDQFWESMQDLTANPNQSGARSVVVQRGKALVETFNHLDRQLTQLQDSINDDIIGKVRDINNYADQIVTLNGQIMRIEAKQGEHANDLRDKRDLLLDKLSKIVGIEVTEDTTGMINVSIGNFDLVTALERDSFILDPEPINLTDPYSTLNIRWASSSGIVEITGGELYGLLESRNPTGVVVDTRNRLNNMVKVFSAEFNRIHEQGVTLDQINKGTANAASGIKFFVQTNSAGALIDPLDIANIKINPLLDDPAQIAAGRPETYDQIPAATTTFEGDGRNALKLSQLKYAKLDFTPASTMDGFYNTLIGDLGVAGQQNTRMKDNQTTLTNTIKNQRNSISSVSLDEEMTNMIRFQQAFNAASRMVSAMDEMLDKLINGMGVVGR